MESSSHYVENAVCEWVMIDNEYEDDDEVKSQDDEYSE